MADLTLELNERIRTEALACPTCGASVTVSPDGRSLLCRGGKTHCFDGGGGGYLPLAPRHSGGGDSKEAVRYRTAFLSKGYYEPAAHALCELIAGLLPENALILDAGCGEGYYSNRLCAKGFDVLGVDLSKFAADAAAKAAKRVRGHAPSRTVYVVGSVFELPVKDACVDAVVNIFAPCAPSEYARVLKPGGYLVVACAGEDHLLGLKKCIYDDPYLNDPRRDLPEEASGLTLVKKESARFEIEVSGGDDLIALFSMTPYYWRTSPAGHEKLAATERLSTPVSFDFYVYRKDDRL